MVRLRLDDPLPHTDLPVPSRDDFLITVFKSRKLPCDAIWLLQGKLDTFRIQFPQTWRDSVGVNFNNGLQACAGQV